MTIIEDTRQQKGKHELKKAYFDANGIKVIRSKLPLGDYANMHDLSVIIDTKKDIQELYSDCVQQHVRFRNELIKAQECDIHLIILVENKDGITSLNDLPRWYNWRKKKNKNALSGKQLTAIVRTMSEKYGATFEFCTPEEAGSIIVDTLSNLQNTTAEGSKGV